MNPLDKLLAEQGLKYEDLNAEERETYNQKYFEVQTLTLTDLKSYITNMKNSVAMQIANTRWFHIITKIKLEERLRNYILLEAFLSSPEKAEQALKKSLASNKFQKGIK